jgi:hypothetical protein
MKKLKLLSLLLLGSYCAIAQNSEFFYDQAGNRTLRQPCMNCRQVHNPKATVNNNDTALQAAELQIAAKHGLNLFPNPTQAKVTLAISNLGTDENASLIVTDEIGKLLYTQNNLQSENQIDMSSYNIGTYFVKVIVGKDITVYKVLRIQ